MLSAIFLGFASLYLWRLLGGTPRMRLRGTPHGGEAAAKIAELTEYASRLRATNKYTAAEKVYLQILKLDHRHVATYSRLGTLYSAQRNYGDAIECFQMTTQLKPSGTTFYNLGLAYFENRNYMKAVAAFEKAVMFEPNVQRYIGLAKAFKKMGDNPRMIGALEQAIQIEENPKILWLLADAYEASRQPAKVAEIELRIKAIDPKDPRLQKTSPRVI